MNSDSRKEELLDNLINMNTIKNKKLVLTNQEKLTLRNVCRVIRDNLDYDSSFSALGRTLGIHHRSNKREINEAAKLLSKQVPYYAITKIPSTDGKSIAEIIRFVRLVPTSRVGIYRVCEETDIQSFLHTIMTDVNSGVVLKVNDYVRVDLNGKIIEIGKSMNSLDSPITNKECGLSPRFKTDKYETPQLLFLKSKQLSEYPIYPVIEVINNSPSYHEELAYIFTICKFNNRAVIVYENSNFSRASYLFIIDLNHYTDTINHIKSYFSSNALNKRSELQKTNSKFPYCKGFVRFVKIIHDDTENWSNNIEYYSKKIYGL